MKKYLLFLFPVLLFIVGCSNNIGKITCTLERDDSASGYKLNSVYVINHAEDLVLSVETEETVTSSNSQIITYFEELLKETYEVANSTYGGYVYDISKTSDSITAKVKIDYDVMNVEKYVNDQQVLKNYVRDGKITVEGVKSIYIAMGATCK